MLLQTPRIRQEDAMQWQYTKYDYLNRPIITGVYTATQNTGDLRNAVMQATGHHESYAAGGINYTLGGSFPTVGEATVRTVSYYDDYRFDHASLDKFNADDTPHRSQVKGQLTGQRIRQLESDKLRNSIIYYDEQQRPIINIAENHVGGFDQVETTYRNAINSEVLKTKHVHKSKTGKYTVR